MLSAKNRARTHLISIYGDEIGNTTWKQLKLILDDFSKKFINSDNRFEISENDAILITYGDQFCTDGNSKLATLIEFLVNYLGNSINTVHLLPFFPYSSDDGFSVIDYTKIDRDIGTWDDIAQIGTNYNLMFDFVLNHISKSSNWFTKYLNDLPGYQDFFIEMDPTTELSMVVRPRALPLLTPFMTSSGEKYLWTTFSADQIDLNYANPNVALKMIEILLMYVSKGVSIIRLDAIAYLWKKAGTKSIHLSQTHSFVKLLRAVLDIVAPHVLLITETNVPHRENISYFGSLLEDQEIESGYPKSDEAQLVYQFTLAPLVLHSFLNGNATKLSYWVDNIESPFDSALFLNFIASHDGIGIRPAEGILSEAEIDQLVEQTIHQGGKVSSKRNSDGSESPYELNITIFDFLDNPSQSLDVSINRYIASQVIMLSLRGIPGIYFHSLFGSNNCERCVERTGRVRSINREKFDWEEFEKWFLDPNERKRLIFNKYRDLLLIRKSIKAFSPFSAEKILHLDSRLFTLFRGGENFESKVLVVVNVSNQPVEHTLPIGIIPEQMGNPLYDHIGRQKIPVLNGKAKLSLLPYQAMWLS